MRVLFVMTMLVTALPDRPNPAPKEVPKTLHEQILGDWEVVKTVAGGGGAVPMKDGEVRTVRFNVKDIQVFVNGVQQPDAGGAYTLDVAKKPVAIDLQPNSGPEKKVEAILKLDGDQLVLAFAINGNRPVDFATQADQLHVVTYLKRVKR